MHLPIFLMYWLKQPLSNPEEEIFLLDPYYQRRMAQQIVEGLEEYYMQYARWPNEELEADK